MFQDYCALHGEPCIPGSLYCCEECWQEELNNSINMVGSDHEINSEQSSTDKYILYDCYKCNTYHEFHISCEEAKRAKLKQATHSNTSSCSYLPISESMDISINDNKPRKSLIQVIHESGILSDDPSVMKGNQLIMTNYQVWLVNLNSRSL